ncbi:tyrosine-type recombinase/integrase [Ktedonospora formicarum]|uniref:Uncharacterized protein n=1 Tax=Ktedonospora formicarum TaxID=2778364 RepID=A0A8J3I7X6_9CHLR|nr:tyrosine-type recombinase/integrase [Ktedonospora formicarum]GHO48495.1 hypothetical protein KSX_66580 [Ktedonospora formicarum]
MTKATARIHPIRPQTEQEAALAFKTIVDLWKDHLTQEDRSKGTIKQYRHALMNFAGWYEAYEGIPLQVKDLTPMAFIAYRNELQHEQRLAPATINMRLNALRTWCGWLVERHELLMDPAARVKLVSGGTISKREGLTNTQVNALLRQAERSRDHERNYAILQVLLQTGMRLSECAALTFGDIVYGERSGIATVRHGKGNKARSVPLNSSAREALVPIVAERLEVAEPTIKAVAAAWSKARELTVLPIWESQKGAGSPPQPWGR